MKQEINLKIMEEMALIAPKGFIKRKDYGNVVLYKYMYHSKAFNNPVLRECRGIIFDKENGDVIQRPFHKFFNYSEPLNLIPFDEKGILTEKVDGSMVAVSYYENKEGDKKLIISMTGSILYHDGNLLNNAFKESEKVFEIVTNTPHLLKTVAEYPEYTFIFEFVSPNAPIIIHYPEPQIRLIHARHKKTGAYMDYDKLLQIAKKIGLETPFIKKDVSIQDVLLEGVLEKKENFEGYVIFYPQFNDFVKLKTVWYQALHGSANGVVMKKKRKIRGKDATPVHVPAGKIIVAKHFFDNTIDELYTTMNPELNKQIQQYHQEIVKEVEESIKTIKILFPLDQYESRKRFALKVIEAVPKELQPVAFNVYNAFLKNGVVHDDVIAQEVFRALKKKYLVNSF